MAALLGFFVVTLDAAVVNVALPHIRSDLHSTVSGLQWVVDGYTLMFAALLLSAGSLSDRIGSRRALVYGLGLFVVASAACGLASNITELVIARFVQGSAAAAVMPSSMVLLTHAYRDPAKRTRAIGIWAMGGSVAAASGPILGGLLTAVSWRLIFFVNVPVGLVALILLTRAVNSPRQLVPFDWAGQATVMVGMTGLVFGVIGSDSDGLGSARVLVPLGIAVVSLTSFVWLQHKEEHPMMPPDLFRIRTVNISVVAGFAFMMAYYGMPFVMSLYFQEIRGETAVKTGLLFLPMLVVGATLNPIVTHLTPRLGTRVFITGGLLSMAVGLSAIGLISARAPVLDYSLLMVAAGVGGPLVMPPIMALLLHAAPPARAGVASGVFNTARQLGGALAIAIFGSMIAHRATFIHGLRMSVFVAAAVILVAAAVTRMLEP